MTSYRLGDVLPNPFRNIDRYPIDRAKVEALKASITRTSFWDNVVARPVGDNAQIAYGHHRLVALREIFPPEHQINLITRDLDDAAMLHIMADENMQEWSASGAVVVETVRAVRDFLHREVAETPSGRGHDGREVNGAAAIVKFLGWPERRVEDALSIILAEEKGVITPEDTAGLELRQAHALRQSVSRIREPEVKRKAIERVRTQIEAGEIGYRGVRDVVNEVRTEALDASRRPKPIVPAALAERLWRDIQGYWVVTVPVGDQTLTRAGLLRLIAENRNAEELSRSVRPWADQLADALDEMSTEAKRLADLLRAEQAVAIGA